MMTSKFNSDGRATQGSEAGNSMSTRNGNTTNTVYAKTLILGDNKSGRTSLISNIDTNKTSHLISRSNRQFNIVIDESNFFTTIELTPSEIEHPNATAFLKVWEYTQHLSKKDEQLAFRGALFCIITFNICKADSYRSVFEKWIPLKEQFSPDSFLYIVGTHLDQFSYRQVELNEICKACAKKDAVYVEVSNLAGTNFHLLRRLLCRRVHYMLEQKELFSSPAFQAKLNSVNNNKGDVDSNNPLFTRSKSQSNPLVIPSDLSAVALEPNIMSNSVGAILSSCFDLEDWEGYERQESQLLQIADQIDAFVEKLAVTAETSIGDLNSLMMDEGVLARDPATMPPFQPQSLENQQEEKNAADLAKHFQELQESFAILGLAMPESLLSIQPPPPPPPTDFYDDFNSANMSDPFAVPNSARPNLRKMMVKLPSGQTAEMVLDLEANMEQQIELFLLSQGLNFDLDARKRLLQVTLKVQREYLDNVGMSGNSGPSSRPRSGQSSRPTTATSIQTAVAGGGK